MKQAKQRENKMNQRENRIQQRANISRGIAGRAGAVLLTAVLMLGLITGCAGKSNSYEAKLPTQAEEAEIYVEPIEGLSEDFIKGVDISSVLAEEESGVVYYNEDGEEEDLFKILADSGVNYIRVRVWNDPYDSDGNGYGGGNNDVAKAAEIGKRAAEYGMKLSVDFHYSDFWADPAKQFAPKEWAHYTFEDKQQAVYDFTAESLKTIADAGADIGMVQIGNEINNGMAGETDEAHVIELLKEGSSAVRAFAKEVKSDVQIAVHYTNIDDYDQIMAHAAALEAAELDYDIFGVSYYAFWHGTMENLTSVLQELSDTYGKKTCVMETSYAYTLEDGDGFDNSVAQTDLVSGYAASVQSQATAIRDVMAAASAANSMGVFYWEPAWVPVGSVDSVTENEKLWEQYGSGWASSYSAKYDPNDAGAYYGGSSWDNQAMFDFTGHKLPSLDVFKYVNYGTTCEPLVDYVEEITVDVNVDEALVMPEKVNVVYNDRSISGETSVTWDEAQVAEIDTSKMAEYSIDGVLEDGTAVTAQVQVAKLNYIVNPSFEEKNVSMWKVTYQGDTNPTDIQKKEADCITGENSYHFWDKAEQDFTIEQTVTGLEAGSYTLNANIQGGDVGKNAEIYLYAVVDGTTYQSDPVTLAGWCNWQTPELGDLVLDGTGDITIGIHVSSAGGGWGTIDDFYLYKQ